MRPRSGPTVPPTPFTACRLTHPLVPRTREPASGFWPGPKTAWAWAPPTGHRTSATARRLHFTVLLMGDPLPVGGHFPPATFPTASPFTKPTTASSSSLPRLLAKLGIGFLPSATSLRSSASVFAAASASGGILVLSIFSILALPLPSAPWHEAHFFS